MELWATKYRPRTFDDVVGQKANTLVLQAMVRKGEVPSGLLFSGERGSGKTSVGRILAAALNCEADGDKPCNQCPSCVAVVAGTSASVIEVDAASHGGVGEIRELIDRLNYSIPGNKRVVLLDEAHSMSKEAYNALLKTLEQPPPDTVFIFLTTEPARILDTVLSRLMSFEFRKIASMDLVKRLIDICKREGVEVDLELLKKIAFDSKGALRDAIMKLDQLVRADVVTLAAYELLSGESDFAPELLRAIVRGEITEVFSLVDDQLSRFGNVSYVTDKLIECLRDVLILANNGTLSLTKAEIDNRKALLPDLPALKAIAALKVLWDLKTKVSKADNERVMLNLAISMLISNLTGKNPVVKRVEAVPEPPKIMSLAEMKAATIEHSPHNGNL